MPISFILRVGSFNIQRSIPALSEEVEVVFDDLIFEAIECIEPEPPPRVQVVPVTWTQVYDFLEQQIGWEPLKGGKRMKDEEVLKLFDEEQMKL